MRGWLRKKTGCCHLAEDLTQDTFLKLLTMAEPEVIRNPRAYLMVAANHVMIDQFRKRKLEEDALAALAQLSDGIEEQSAEQCVAISQLVATALHILNDELDEKVQRAFIMERVEGYAYRDIAQALDVSESSVKQYLAKAMIHFHSRIFSLGGKESTIPYWHKYMAKWENQERLSESYRLSGTWDANDNNQFSLSLMHSPHTSTYVRANTKDGAFTNKGGGDSINLQWDNKNAWGNASTNLI